MVTPYTPRLVVRDLTVRYGDLAAVDHVDLEVAEGEVVAILGPSGCGKSSLLRAIAGLEPCTGSVSIDGVNVSRERPDRRRLGLMFQGHALFPHADVAGNVGFGLRMQGWSRDRVAGRVAEVLDLVRLPGAGSRQVDTLSGGEQQRVALARAIAPDPRVLMLDEPLSSVDRALRDELLGDLPVVLDRIGAAVLHVTHDQEEALAVADRVAVMREGRIVQVGPSMQVWHSPVDADVARFLGQHNLLPATVRDGVAESTLGRCPAGDVDDGPAWVLVPPEAATRQPPGVPHDDGHVHVPARVRARRFAGDHLVLTTTTEQGLRLDVADAAADAPSIGDDVTIVVDLDRVRVLPGDAETGTPGHTGASRTTDPA